MEIQLNIQAWKDNGTGLYVAYVPQLDVSSCGKTLEEAHKNIQESVHLFLEEAESLGTIQEILEEAGFVFLISSTGHTLFEAEVSPLSHPR